MTLLREGELLSNAKEVANEFNHFFRNEPQRIVSNITSNTPPTLYGNLNTNPHSMFLDPFTEEELLVLLKNKLKNKYSAGPDDVPDVILKKCLPVLTKPLTHLINTSFCEGTFPSALKICKVNPVYKKGDRTHVGNYRPVALSSVFSKIFELAMLDRFLNFINKHNLLTSNQHGFRQKHSTTTAINAFIESVVAALEAGNCPVGIFCDLSRAFDCVDPTLLLPKLEEWGVRGVPLKWFQSFLDPKKQYVEIPVNDGQNLTKVESDILEIILLSTTRFRTCSIIISSLC